MKKRILILTGVFPPDIGGPATQLDALVKELIKHGYQVCVLTFGKKDQVQYSYKVKRVSNAWPHFLKSFFYLITGLRLALKNDILYSYDLYTAGLTGLILRKILGKSLVIRFVGDSAWETASARGLVKDDIIIFQSKKYSWGIELRKKIRKQILNNSDKIIVASHFLKSLTREIGLAEEKVKVIYNSVDFFEIKPGLKNKQALKEKFNLNKIVLLTIARLTPWKGVDMLIEIMPDLVKKYQEINLVVVGQGPEFNNLKQLAQNINMQNHIIFTGKLDRFQIVDYLRASDVFVLNTNYEGMSHCLLEAMKMETPIITTSAGGNPETIKDKETGLLVDYRDKEQWLKAINNLLDDPDLAKRLANQAKQDLKRFSWSKLVQETINVFQNL
jgi:glycosyltransferase involved in cell wall biosynthesis|tara:strand:+ start:7740 stop:8900 length:1161 start_codon:yes stop_codon:yes gene_type:complete